ncbi:MAG TPA: C40 family peptidase [Pedococcus sp.]|uniref:C40 family peptidase n=1 Tax=Pedococcus sp. TaxID=2860345 RepID=UPI002F93A897
MAHHAAGRHRAPGRFNPLSELTGIVAQSAQPAVKTSAVLAASGGLVAAFAIPAHAAPAEKPEAATAAAAPVAAVKAPASPAPSQTAFGEIGFTATAKPKPKPRPAPAPEPAPERVEQAASRSVERAPLPSTKPATGGILGIAAQYEGIMYSYGGTSPETGFDCSGYTQYVFRQVGISLPRTAEEQRQAVTPVSDPQPGDLVFFGAPASHVGIYAGNGMMWDSPRSGKAVALRDIWSADVTYGRP